MSKKKKHKKQSPREDAPVQQIPQPKKSLVKSYRLHFILIALLAFAFYGNTLKNSFAFDDSVVITGNAFTRQGVKGIPDLVTSDLFAGIYGKSLELTGGRYRPVPLITHAVEYSLWEDKRPGLNHFMNILFYAGAGIALFLTLNKLLKGASVTAFVATVLFMIHPIHTEVVANIKSRDEIICFLFLMLTLLYLFRYVNEGVKKYFGLSLFFYACSLFTKEHGITFMAVIPLTLYFFSEEKWKTIMKRTLPYLGIAVAYLVFRSVLLNTSEIKDSTDVMENPFYGVALNEKLGTVLVIMGKYLQLLVFPHPLSSDYSYNAIPYTGIFTLPALISLVILLGLAGFALLKLKQKNIFSFCILFYFATISIVSNLFFNIGAPMGERFVFLPSLAFCLAVAVLLIKLLKAPEDAPGIVPAKLYAPLLLLSIPCAYLTIDRNADWKNNEVLFSKDVQTVPNSGKANYYYGNVLFNAYTDSLASLSQQRKMYLLSTAKKHTLIAARIAPQFFHAHLNLGKIYLEEGESKADSAIYHLEKVTTLLPPSTRTEKGKTIVSASEKYIEALHGLARCWAVYKKNTEKAIAVLNTALQYGPNNAATLLLLGRCHAMSGNTTKAEEFYMRSMAINPMNWEVYNDLGQMYGYKGDQARSQEYYNKAAQLKGSK